MPKKLIVNDNSDYVNRWQAFRWFSDSDVITLSIGSTQEFIDGLNGLIRQHMVFDRVLFRTHGWHTGIIWFGDNSIGAGDWPNLASKINFTALFPGTTKIYFDACETADAEAGDKFLTSAGQTLLRAGGGSTSGWSSWGFSVPGIIPFIGGHTMHIPNDNNLKTFHFKPGGILEERRRPLGGEDRPRYHHRNFDGTWGPRR
jgi:hypothetical protein